MEFDVRVAAGIESCFVSLPITLINTLASTVSSTYLPPILALQLRSSHNNLWHVAWSGSASSPPSASSIQIAQQYAECIRLSDRMVVEVRVVSTLPKASMVTIEPDTEYDWEVMELNSELAEQAILKQTHKDAKGVWDSRFPYLEVLETIYPKDRVTGRGALGFEEAIGQMEVDLEIDQSMSINLDDLNVEDDHSEAPTSRSQNSELSKKRKKLAAVRGNDAKKMKGSTSVAHDTEVEGLRKEVSAAFQGISTHFATIASAIADENN
nr:peroxisome biogenesis protein 1 [Ipomoea batatas]